MKVIVLVKQGAGGSGTSRATRYISLNDPDVAREESEPRKLFSEKENTLGFFQANRALGNGQEPKVKDVLHLVISLEKEEDFHRLGANEESRQKAMREAMRGTMKQVAEDLKTDDLRWVAGIHRNTDNPHVHLLIHRDYTHRETGRMRRLKTLPPEMRVSWERAPDGKRITNPGSLSQTFVKLLEKQIEREKETDKPHTDRSRTPAQITYGERLLLGQALIAEDKIERLTKMRDDNVHFGDRFRYEFTNGQNRSRGFSEHDVHQRASAKANQMVADSPAILTSEERVQMREEIVTAEFNRHEELVKKHRETRAADLQNIELKLSRAVDASRHLIEKAAMIKSRYEGADGSPPVPILPRAKLSKFQDRAIERSETERIQKLEEIRVALAAENGSPVRTDRELGRLRAQLFVGQSRLTTEQDSARRFEESKHLLRWELPTNSVGKAQGEKWVKRSLAEIERALAWEQDQAMFIGARQLHWDDDRRSLAQIRLPELSRQREMALDRIEAERAEISIRISRHAEFVAALYQIVSKEEDRYHEEGREMPALLFNTEELKELDNTALRLRDPEFYRKMIELERNYDARTDQRKPVSIQERTSRALARVSLAEIGLRESELNLVRFNEQPDLIDVVVKDDGGRNISIARLADTPPPSPLEQLIQPLIVPDERRAEVATAVESYGQRLTEQYKKASASHVFLSEEARAREEEFSRTYPGKPLPEPRFTYREISNLELHAAKETDPTLKAKYETLYRQALENPYEDRSRTILIEKDADELLDPVSANDHPQRNTESQFIYGSVHSPEYTREMSFER